MKKTIYILLALLLTGVTTIHAQVTVGSNEDAHAAAILDLSQTGKKMGVLPPQVELTGSIADFQLITSPSDTKKTDAIGMIVYNTGTTDPFREGYYEWDGEKWIPLTFDCPSFVQDFEGNIYRAKRFGTQCWMIDNLRSIITKNGSTTVDIAKVNPGFIAKTDGALIATRTNITMPVTYTAAGNPSSTIKGYYIENGDTINLRTDNTVDYEAFASKFGFLYNSDGAQIICPAGWKLPSENEWITLANSLGGTDVAGAKIKANNWTYVSNDNYTYNWGNYIPTNAYPPGDENNAGFNALPAGYVRADGGASNCGDGTWWWTSDTNNSISTYISLSYGEQKLDSYSTDNARYYSVRCIKE